MPLMIRATMFGLLAALMTCASAGQSPAEDSNKHHDLSRIVVIGGALTEVIYALGQEARIVAVDSTSQYPEIALKSKKNVGYMRALSTEGILSMSPSVIIASDKAGPPEVVKALKSGPIPYLEVDDRPDPAALIGRITFLSELLDAKKAGKELIAKIEAGFKTLADARTGGGPGMRTLFVLSVRNGRMIVGGHGTAADEMLKIAGLVNAGASIEGFKPISEEALVEMAPEIVLTISRSADRPVRDEVLAMAAIRATPAAAQHRVIEVDALRFLGFGPRAPDAALELKRSIAEAKRLDGVVGQR